MVPAPMASGYRFVCQNNKVLNDSGLKALTPRAELGTSPSYSTFHLIFHIKPCFSLALLLLILWYILQVKYILVELATKQEGRFQP